VFIVYGLSQSGEVFSVSQSAFSVKVYIKVIATHGISRLQVQYNFFCVDLSYVSEISERNVFGRLSCLTYAEKRVCGKG
jgi:hypothetical protein